MARYSLTRSSFIVCLDKSKGDAWKRGNKCGLKLTKQVMKVLERIVDCLIRQLVSIDDSQFGFCPRQRHNRCNLCSQAAGRVSGYQQETLHGFCRPGEGFWCSASKGYQVGAEKTWYGLCDWCMGCMPMGRAMSMFVRGTVKSLKWMLVFTKTQYSACYSSSLCLKPCHASSALGSPGRTFIPMTL